MILKRYTYSITLASSSAANDERDRYPVLSHRNGKLRLSQGTVTLMHYDYRVVLTCRPQHELETVSHDGREVKDGHGRIFNDCCCMPTKNLS